MCVLFLFLTLSAAAETPDSLTVNPTDSLTAEPDASGAAALSTDGIGTQIDRVSSSHWYRMTYVGAPLIICGLISKHEDRHFRNLRNDYMPYFHRNLDNYTQFLPAAALLGMKAAGVKGRNSWGRMLTSDAIATALMAGVVQSLKMSTHVMRPDGSDNHSFPSGHTATAFMTATMLTKEYGYLSPWIGVGAYGVASATGLMRMANNKHWLSDVLTGAGIGILSTEVGYWLAGMIFKDKGINHVDAYEPVGRLHRPSFAGLYLGMNVPVSKYDIDEEHSFHTSYGSTAGVEGAYFISPYIGFGGRFTISNTHIIVNGNEAEDDTYDAETLSEGLFFSYPITSRWLIGSKLLGGMVHYPRLKLNDMEVKSRNGAALGSGLAVTFNESKHYGIRFFLDYNLMPAHSRGSREWMSTFTLGSSFAVTF